MSKSPHRKAKSTMRKRKFHSKRKKKNLQNNLNLKLQMTKEVLKEAVWFWVS